MNKRLYRSRRDSFIGGVAGGLAEYFAVDPVIVRLVLLISILFGGTGLFLYVAAWILIPANPVGPSNARFEKAEQWRERVIDTARDVEQDIIGKKVDESTTPDRWERAQNEPTFSSSRSGESGQPAARSNPVIGWILIGIGGLFLLQNAMPWFVIESTWPLVLILVGVFFIGREVRR